MRCFKCLIGLMLLWGSSAAAEESGATGIADTTPPSQTVVNITTADELNDIAWKYGDNTTLQLQNNVTPGWKSQDIFGKNNIIVDGGFVVDGKDQRYSILGNSEWLINETHDFTFQNVIFNNFEKGDMLHIIETKKGSVKLDNVIMQNVTQPNAAYDVWGGAIDLADNSELTILNSLFENINIASSSNAWPDSVTGGVLYVQGNEGNGGGTSVVNLIKNSTFKNNSLTSLGGKNTYGGAIYLEGIIKEINNSIFEGNSAQAAQNGVTAYGGAIAGGGIKIWEYARRGAATIGTIGDLTQFNKNFVKSAGDGYGGAIYSSGLISSFVGTQFNGNYVEAENAYGGAIASTTSSGEKVCNPANPNDCVIIDPANIALIRRAVFDGNYVSAANTAQGGAIYSGGNSVYVTGFFYNNHANGTLKGEGGAIYNSTGKMKNAAGEFVDKVAQYYSGVFRENYVKGNLAHGGALYNEGTINNIAMIPGYENALNADFVGNYADAADMAVGGGVYNNGKIGTIDARFDRNYTIGVNEARGGGLANTINGTIDTIKKAFFTYNSASATGANGVAKGGAIFNNSVDATQGDLDIAQIDADFTGNYASAANQALGGAFYNAGKVGDIVEVDKDKMTFDKNHTNADNISAGGAVYNEGALGNVVAHFVENVAESVYSAMGGALHNAQKGTAKDIDSDFTNNSVVATAADGTAKGGAVYNSGTITSIGNGNDIFSYFSQNYALSEKGEAAGGAIYNEAMLGSIKADFSNNYAEGNTAMGGAIYTKAAAGGTITGTFKNNYAGGKTSALGGAVFALSDDVSKPVEFVNSEFENNKAYLSATNATRAAGQALGGAVYGNALKFTAKGLGEEVKFKGNTAGDTKNAIYVAGTTDANVEFAALEGGKVLVYDDVDGVDYDMLISGDGSKESETVFYGNVDNVKKLSVGKDALVRIGDSGNITTENYITADSSTTNLFGTLKATNYQAGGGSISNLAGMLEATNYQALGGSETNLTGTLNATNYLSMEKNALMHLGRTGVINAGNYKAEDGAQLILDIAITDKPENGIIKVSGDVQGTTTVLMNVLNGVPFDGILVKFVEAPNDIESTAADFKPDVAGSSYEWVGKRNANGETSGSVWYMTIKGKNPVDPNPPVDPVDPIDPPVDPDDPDDDKPNKPDDNKPNKPNPDDNKPTVPSDPVYKAEIAAYTGLQTIAVEQNRSIASSVAKGIAAKKSTLCYQETCGIAELMPKKKAWIDMTYENAKIDTPAEVDAKISGTTLGIDFYRLGSERAGLFGAYRHGKYDFSGEGRYYAETGTDVTNKSWLGGAYYQYDDENWKVLGTVFAGKQEMDIKTDNRKVFADTDAKQYGASAEVTKHFALTDEISLSPSLGLYYTTLDIDTIHDNMRKQAKFDTLHYGEAEVGAAVEYVSCHDGNTRRIYAKPSIIRTFADGGRMRMSDIDKPFDTFEERTLGRIELGGNFGLNDKWNGYAETGYTFGDDYKAYDFTVGVGYRF